MMGRVFHAANVKQVALQRQGRLCTGLYLGLLKMLIFLRMGMFAGQVSWLLLA